MSSKTFVIGLADAAETESRAARRIVVNADLLKTSKMGAGDIVALVSEDFPSSSNKVCLILFYVVPFFQCPLTFFPTRTSQWA